MPNLLLLNMSITYMDREHGRVLGEAIGGGALSGLEELCFSGNMSMFTSMGNGGVVPIMASLEGGG